MATLTVFPVAGANSPVDGYARRAGIDEAFATIRAGAGTHTVVTSTVTFAALQGSTTTNQYKNLYRNFTCFDTSALTAAAVISSAVLSLHGAATSSNVLGSTDIHIAAANLASTANVVAGDFVNVSRTSFASMTYAAFNNSAYNAFTLNASGITNINKTGISQFSQQIGWDLDNSFTGSWVSDGITEFDFYNADETGTSQDPMLVVTYTIASPVTFQTTGVTDTWIEQGTPTANNSTSIYLIAGMDNIDSAVRRGLIKFPIDNGDIPAGATITSAILTLTVAIDRSDNARTLHVYRLKQAMVASQATYNIYSTGNNWATAGAGNTTTDREATDIGSVTQLATYSAGDPVTISLNVAKIQEMISGGAFTNNGFLLQVDTENLDEIIYSSTEETTAAYRPKLVIAYTTVADFFTDHTTNGNDLSPVNGVIAVTSSLASITGNLAAVDLEASSSQTLSAPDSASLSITGTLTLEAWVKRESTGAFMNIIGKYETGTEDRSYRLRFNSDDTLRFDISSAGTGASNTSITTTATYTDTTNWHHYAVEYNPATTDGQFYVDGVAVEARKGSLASSIFNSIAPFYVGGEAQYMDGQIDEVRVWNTARTSTEIGDNYDIQLTGSESGLAAYYTFNDLTGGGGGGGGTGNFLGIFM